MENSDVRARVRQALSQPTEEPEILLGVVRSLLYFSEPFSGGMAPTPKLRYFPELEPLLFHENRDVRQTARRAISYIDPDAAAPLVKQLLAVLDDESRGADHIEAIRALAVLGGKAKPAISKLVQIARTEQGPVRIAAALAAVNLDGDAAGDWGRQSLERLFGPEVASELNADMSLRLLATEREQLVPANDRQFPGGGGGVF